MPTSTAPHANLVIAKEFAENVIAAFTGKRCTEFVKIINIQTNVLDPATAIPVIEIKWEPVPNALIQVHRICLNELQVLEALAEIRTKTIGF